MVLLLDILRNRYCIFILFFFIGCSNRKNYSRIKSIVLHDIEIHERGIGRITLDRVDASKFVSKNAGAFRALSVLFEDSVRASQKDIVKNSNYYNYLMEHDWVLLNGGDSIHTVFFQPTEKEGKGLSGGILVFEWPFKEAPDTLIFLDSQRKWGQHILFLHEQINYKL